MTTSNANTVRDDGPESCSYLGENNQRCINARVDSTGFCVQHSAVLYHVVYSEAAEHLRQDVREFWSRNGFFLLVEGGLFTVYMAVGRSGLTEDLVDRAARYLPLLGGLIAVVWFWIASWSVYWIGRWHQALIRIEDVLDPWKSHLWAGRIIQRRSAVQGAAIIVPPLFAAGWTYVSWHKPGEFVGAVGWVILAIGVLALLLMGIWIPQSLRRSEDADSATRVSQGTPGSEIARRPDTFPDNQIT